MIHFLAMVVLERAALPDLELLRRPHHGIAPAGVAENDGTVSFHLDGAQVLCALMPAPIPPHELVPMLETSPYWTEGEARIAEHQAHFLVTAITDQPVEKKQLALTLSRAISAVLKATPAAFAVYWGAGSVVTPKKVFCDFADEATIDLLPLYAWIDFRCFPVEGGCGVFTHGMGSLGFMEIEVTRSTLPPEDTVGFVYNVAHYLLDRGPVLQHGNTIGMSATQKIKVTHVKGAFLDDAKVYHLALGS